MKKIMWCAAGVLALAAAAWASAVVFSGFIVNQPALAYNSTYALDLKTAGRNGRSIDTLAAQAVYSSTTFSNATFTDGGLSVNHLTVSDNTGLVAVAATDQITVASTSSLKNAIVIVKGKQLRQGYDWFVGTGTATTAVSLASVINKITGIQASAAGGVVYATATVAGTAANAYAVTKISASNLTIAHATFTGGVDNAYVTLNGVTLTQGTDWTRASTSSGTAKAISNAIMATSALSTIFHSTWTSAVVYATSTAVGTNAYACVGFPSANLVWAAAVFTSGSDAAWTLNSATIHKVGHGLYTAVPVLYSTGTLAISGLTNQTTYYAYRIDADNFKLATSTTNAVAGTGIVLASTSTAGPHTYTLAPLAITGTFSFKWQASDDGTNWTDMSVSSVTFPSPYTAGSTLWDFGAVGHRYVRVNVAAGTTGAMNLQVSGTGRNSN